MADNLSAAAAHVTGGGSRIFVAGATGYTGHALVRALVRRGHRVTGHVRPDSRNLDEWRARLTADGARVSTAAWTLDGMRAALAEDRPATVYALLGTTRARMRRAGKDDSTSYEAVDYGLTALLLRACLDAVPDTHFVYLSAIGVGPRARGAYLQVRWRMEEELRASGISHDIVRPAFITGSDRAESRPAERAGAVLVDTALRVAALLGARGLHQRYRTRTAAELAEELADLAR